MALERLDLGRVYLARQGVPHRRVVCLGQGPQLELEQAVEQEQRTRLGEQVGQVLLGKAHLVCLQTQLPMTIEVNSYYRLFEPIWRWFQPHRPIN